MDRKNGWIYLMLDNKSGLVREDGSLVNYRFELAEPQTGTPSQDWAIYDGTRVSFAVDGDRAVDVTGEKR
jgi:hypothetical protein